MEIDLMTFYASNPSAVALERLDPVPMAWALGAEVLHEQS
jgi:hypothetical protein